MKKEVNKPKNSLKLRIILRIVQLFGLTPFNLDTHRMRSKRSRILLVYNVTLAILFILNVYTSEKDEINNVEYNNISLLIGIAFDAVDVFGNLCISYSLIRSTLNTATSLSAWFGLKAIDGKLADLDILFDYEKITTYTCLNILFYFLFVLIFTVNEILLCARLNIFYTTLYWITLLCPLYYTTFVSLVFGSVSLAIFQRYWVINNFLRELGNNSHRDFSSNVSFLGKRQVQPRGILTQKKTPFYIMLKNKGDCWGKEKYFAKKIKILKEIHFDLFRLMNDINSTFGFHFFFQFAFCFSACTINLYYVIIYHLRQFDLEQYISSAFWTIILFSLAVYVVFHTNLIINEAHRSTELIHMLLVKGTFPDLEAQNELNVFSTQLMQCPIYIKAGGFFEVNTPLIFQFLTGVLSSVVFVVQFDKINIAS